ncbi:MAG: T9SS type A sorting domain-containing protein [Candidatus Marinimicrobia bacterium]|nr:T9SS type A sorting domain-containing protein [Candidatus Neomarinimicrobiota bacterium]
MRKLVTLIMVVTLLTVFSFAQINYNKIKVYPQNAQVAVGDVVEYKAIYIDDEGNIVESGFDWTVEPETAGSFSENVFTAESIGEAQIEVTLDTLVGHAEVEIVEESELQTGEFIRICPRKERVLLGKSLLYYLFQKDADGLKLVTADQFAVSPEELGVFESNVFTAESVGEGIITASYGELEDTVDVEVFSREEKEKWSANLPRIKIYPQLRRIALGDTIDFKVAYRDTAEVVPDTNATLSIIPDSLGHFTEDSLFVADYEGEGILTAELDTLADTMYIKIEAKDRWRERYQMEYCLTLFPKDTIVDVGESIAYDVKFNDDGSWIDTVADKWELEGMDIGVMDGNVLKTNAPGFALVRATIGDNVGTSFVIAENPESDPDTNTITITRPQLMGQNDIHHITDVKEGGIWKIGGLPHPFNLFNGGFIYFPMGSLDEDIRINISIPNFAEIRDDTVIFNNEFLTGINFDVYVGDEKVETYEFNTPLIVGMVYKKGLIDQLNINPESLNLYFVSDNMELDPTGIENTTLGYYHKMVFSNVAHFSTLAIKGEKSTTAIETRSDQIQLPESIKLYKNYPNPFNPVTNISYEIPRSLNVELKVYNVIGQNVVTLISGQRDAGKYTVEWDAGNLPSGIYLIRLKAGQKVSVDRALLLK